MSELLTIATGEDQVTHHADWVELMSFSKADGSISREDLARAINRVGHVTDDHARDLADRAFDELADRVAALSHLSVRFLGYPFELIKKNQVLQYTPRRPDRMRRGLAYMFLLTVTRHSMDARKRKHAGIDPTEVFERLCSDVLLKFWGGPHGRCGAIIVGTAARRNGRRRFPTVIDDLCDSLKEGGGWKTGALSPGAGDGGLDLAVWRRFADERPGALVGFAQCKTGVHWRDDLSKLRPRAFCGLYMKTPLLLDPQAVYMVPCRVNQDRWEQYTRNSSAILFDRCRLVEYGELISKKTLSHSAKWLAKALESHGVGV